MATYYVKTGGNDSLAGTSDATAWATISKVNGRTFSAGDQILFNKGNTWSGSTLTIPSSGSAGNPITFGCYGTGANPLIDATNTQANCITLTGRSYITIDGIDCKNATAYGIASPSNPGTNVIIKNLTVSYIGRTNTDLQHAIFQQGGYLTVDHCTITRISHCGIMMGGSHNTITNNNISYTNLYYTGWGAGINGTSSQDDISYNTIDYCGGVGEATKTHGIYVGLTNSQVHHNTISHSTKGSGIKAVSGGDYHHNYITGSYLSGIETGTNGGSTGATVNIYYNIFTGNRQAISESAQGSGPFTLNIYNNVCYYNNSTQEDSYYAEIALDENINTSLVIKNNILFGYGRYTYAFNAAQTHAVISNNCVYQASGSLIYYNGGARTWATWQGYGFDTNGVNSNPLFVTPGTDFHLQSTSPCINKGTNVGLTLDYAGQAVTNPPEIGAYEQAVVQPPTGNIYYVSPTGNDSNNGTSTSTPWANLDYAFNRLASGDILNMRGGTYRTTYGASGAAHLNLRGINGTSNSHITIQNYSGEVPVFDLGNITTNQTSVFALFMQNSSYIDIKGLTITGLAQPSSATNVAGFYVVGSSHILLERCVCHHMGGYGYSCNNSTYITYKNCDAHHCADPFSSNGAWENANGFGVTGGVAQNTSDNVVFDGCRSWHNCDDGFDFYGVDAGITLNNCWSFWNGYNDSFTHTGNGQGFKLGPNYTTTYNSTVRRTITNCIAAHNYYHGFDQNTSSSWGSCKMNFYNNVAYENGQWGWEFTYMNIANTFRNNVALSNVAGTSHRSALCTSDHNTWDSGVNVTTDDFSSIDINQLAGARNSDGSLPIVTFVHLKAGSDLIHAGTNVGLVLDGEGKAYATPNPSIGSFEYGTGGGSTILTVTGQTLSGTYTAAHTTPTTFTFTNNYISAGQSGGYVLNAGDEAAGSYNNNLNDSVITGNKIVYTGSATGSATHGIFAGFNINDVIKYNYIQNCPYGVVLKSGNAGTSMSDTTGIVAYNIFKDCNLGVIARGYGGAKIYNNTFYSPYQPYPNGQIGGIIYVEENESAGNAPSPNCKIKNNIFYTTYNEIIISITNKAGTSASLIGFESDYNIFYSAAGNPQFVIGSTYYTFAQWQALGYDVHSIVINPNFTDTTNLLPSTRRDYGTNLGSNYLAGLSTTASWTVGVVPALTDQNGTWQSGARVYGNVVPTLPTITTTSVTSITNTTASSGGNVTSDGGASVTVRGICWSTSTNPTTSSSNTSNGTGTGSFSSSITGLVQNTTYHVRAYATNSVGTAYGSDIQFVTPVPASLPTITTSAATNVSYTTVTLGGNVTSEGGSAATRGICGDTSQLPTLADTVFTSSNTGTGSFTLNVDTLTPGVTYYVRAWATNSAGTSYGSQISFTTLTYSVPSITTTSISVITQTTATSGGSVTSDGGYAITAKGVCWSTSTNPVASGSHTTNGSGNAVWSSSITGLTANTVYYVRAYATNSMGTGYGSQISFTTSANVPTVTSGAATSITSNSCHVSGTVVSEGGTNVTARGVCWSTSANPTILNSKTTITGGGIGTFATVMSGLTASTIYHFRTYATNIIGTGYSSDYTVTTSTASLWASVMHTIHKWHCGADIGPLGYGALYNWYAVSKLSNINYKDVYGGLYNWYAGNTGKLAPSGWHLPTIQDFYDLVTYCGGELDAGGHLKETGLTHWVSPNMGADNSTGFNGLPGGSRNHTSDSLYASAGFASYFLSSHEEVGEGYDVAGLLQLLNQESWGEVGVLPKALGMSVRLIKNDSTDPGTITDYDNNVYPTVKIGNQVWMASNLKVTHYNDGTLIPIIEDNSAWHSDTLGAMCYYNNNVIYDAIAPIGWHVPTKDEYISLITTLSSDDNNPGYRAREVGTTHWNTSTGPITNSSGFTAFGGGYSVGESFTDIKNTAAFLTSDISGIAYELYNEYQFEKPGGNWPKTWGASIRFIKDDSTPADCIDIDGNNYGHTVIGTQVWTTKNFKGTHYNDGTPIINSIINTNGGYAYYNNDPTYA